MNGRGVLGLMAAIWAAPMPAAYAQSFPERPIRYSLPSSPGSGSDTIGRIVAAGLSSEAGQQVIVENRPGGGSNIGAAAAAKAPADGYTLFQANMTHAANVTLYRKLTYDIVADFAPVTLLATSPSILVVHPSLPVKSVKELVALAKRRPGQINYSSAGTGTPTFVAAELFKSRAAIDMLHVPYRGGAESLNAVIAGEVSVYFAPVATALQQARSGRVRALAVTSSRQLPFAPEYPTIAELGFPGYQAGNWYGVVVPVKTPRDTVTTLRSLLVATLKRPDVSKRLGDLGYVVIGSSPDEFGAFIKSEIADLAKILKEHRISGD